MDNIPEPEKSSNPFSTISNLDQYVAPNRVEKLRTAHKNSKIVLNLRATLRRLGLKFQKTPKEFFDELMADIEELPIDD